MNDTFDSTVAHAHCRVFGLIASIVWSISFVCAMQRSILLAQMGQAMGFMSIFILGRQLRTFRTTIFPLTFPRAWWMAALSFFYATIITTLVQFIYMRFFDHGQLSVIFEELLNVSEYRMLLKSMGDSEGIETVRTILASPILITQQLFWMNLVITVTLSLPAALIGYFGRTSK